MVIVLIFNPFPFSFRHCRIPLLIAGPTELAFTRKSFLMGYGCRKEISTKKYAMGFDMAGTDFKEQILIRNKKEAVMNITSF